MVSLNKTEYLVAGLFALSGPYRIKLIEPKGKENKIMSLLCFS